VTKETDIVNSVIVPLLGALRHLHARRIGHHHISPHHVFLLAKRANRLALSAPCPLAAPQDVNEILIDDLPDEYFPPDMWVRTGSGYRHSADGWTWCAPVRAQPPRLHTREEQ
jgi:hypothetical protein